MLAKPKLHKNYIKQNIVLVKMKRQKTSCISFYLRNFFCRDIFAKIRV